MNNVYTQTKILIIIRKKAKENSNMKAHTRFLSIILALMLILGTVFVAPVSVSAAETDKQDVSADSNVSVTATNSLGKMMTDLQKQEEAEQQNTQYANSICDIVVDREKKTAVVDLRVFCDAKLTVAILDDESGLFALSGMTDIKSIDTDTKSDNGKVTVQLDTSKELPEYFTAKAFLTDPVTNIPLAQVYECDTYTRQMQEFLAKTVDDFDEEDVLNLDNDKTKNFLVYGEGTQSISSEKDNINRLTSRDDENRVYTFENIDDQFKEYTKDDVLTYHEGLNDMLIIKIDSISISGKKATITGSETHIEDAFEFVKIDSTGCNDKVETDFSDLPEAVTRKSGDSKKDIAGTGSTWVDEEMSASITESFSIKDDDDDKEDDKDDDKDDGESGISADLSVDLLVNVSLGVEVKCYYARSWGERDADFSFIIKSEIELNGNINLKVEAKYPIGHYVFMPIPCITVEVTPKIVFRGEISATLNCSISAQQGKRYHNGEIIDLSKSPEWNADLSLEASVFIGLALSPKVTVCRVLAEAELEAEAGVEITASSSLSEMVKNVDSVRHSCLENNGTCIEGEIYAVVNLSFKLELCKAVSVKADASLLNKKITDFYYTSKYEPHFGFTTCPHKTYRVDFSIVDSNSRSVNGVTVESIKDNKKTVTTGSGNASMFLHQGEAQITLSKNDVQYTKTINVKEPCTMTLTFGETVSASEMQENTHHWSDSANYYLTGDGVLYLFPLPKKNRTETYDGEGGLTQNEMKQAVKKVIITKGFEIISGDTFKNYTNLTNAVLPDTLTEIGSSSFARSGLNGITIPNSVTTIGSEAFRDCESLTTVNCRRVVSQTSTSTNRWLDQHAFSGCTSLRSVVIPDSLNKICDSAFYDCKMLSSVTLPNGLTTIGSHSFQNCKELKGIQFPDTLTEIGNCAFANTGLTAVTLPASTKKQDNSFDKNVIINRKGVAQTGAEEDLESAETALDEAAPDEITENGVTNDENPEVDPEEMNGSDKNDLATTGDTGVVNDENTVTRDHLVPGSEALFIVVSGTKDDFSFDAASLLYIDQKTVDENGTVSFSAPPITAADAKVSVIYGQCAHEADKPSALDHGSATITYCKHCGDAINIQGEDTGAYLPGDIDGDGEVTVIDATFIQRYCINLPIPISEENVMRGDINSDGEIDIIDATWIQRLEANLVISG